MHSRWQRGDPYDPQKASVAMCAAWNSGEPLPFLILFAVTQLPRPSVLLTHLLPLPSRSRGGDALQICNRGRPRLRSPGWINKRRSRRSRSNLNPFKMALVKTEELVCFSAAQLGLDAHFVATIRARLRLRWRKSLDGLASARTPNLETVPWSPLKNGPRS